MKDLREERALHPSRVCERGLVKHTEIQPELGKSRGLICTSLVLAHMAVGALLASLNWACACISSSGKTLVIPLVSKKNLTSQRFDGNTSSRQGALFFSPKVALNCRHKPYLSICCFYKGT